HGEPHLAVPAPVLGEGAQGLLPPSPGVRVDGGDRAAIAELRRAERDGADREARPGVLLVGRRAAGDDEVRPEASYVQRRLTALAQATVQLAQGLTAQEQERVRVGEAHAIAEPRSLRIHLPQPSFGE